MGENPEWSSSTATHAPNRLKSEWARWDPPVHEKSADRKIVRLVGKMNLQGTGRKKQNLTEIRGLSSRTNLVRWTMKRSIPNLMLLVIFCFRNIGSVRWTLTVDSTTQNSTPTLALRCRGDNVFGAQLVVPCSSRSCVLKRRPDAMMSSMGEGHCLFEFNCYMGN